MEQGGYREKLKFLKAGLKTLHQRDFARLDERIDGIRNELEAIQGQLAANHTDLTLQCKEKRKLAQLRKFLAVQERSRLSDRNEVGN